MLPSKSYFDLGNSPFVEVGDFNRSNVSNEPYSYGQLTQLLDQRYPRSTPGSTGASFHDAAGQDDWRGDQSGVEYHQIVGEQSHNQTPGQVVAQTQTFCFSDPQEPGAPLNCFAKDNFKVNMTNGDHTVPVRSARRIADGIDFAPKSTRWYFRSTSDEDDEFVEHTALSKYPAVHDIVLYLLGRGPKPSYVIDSPVAAKPKQPAERLAFNEIKRRPQASSFYRSANFLKAGGSASRPKTIISKVAVNMTRVRALRPTPDVSTIPSDALKSPTYYLTVNGVDFVSITDDAGHTNTRIDDTFALPVPNVTYDLLGDQAILVSMPTDKTYTITFRNGANPIALELLKGIDNITPTEAVRYQDLKLPSGVTAMLKITPEGVSNLAYDKDNDGVFETIVTPTISVSGAVAQDVEPPAINFSAIPQKNKYRFTITATDNASGVKAVYYSLDGKQFQQYTNPLNLDPAQTRNVYAFADDNVANRSGMSKYELALITYNPVTPTVSVTGGTFTYDGAPHTATGTVLGVNGEDLGIPVFTYNGAGDPPVNAGDYEVVASFAGNDTYATSNSSALIHIDKAMPTIEWSNPSDITYGTPLSDTQLNATAMLNRASVPGAFAYSIPAGTSLDAGGNQNLSVTFTPTDTGNLQGAAASVTINVLKAVPTVNITGGTFTYDAKEHPATGSITGVGGESLGTPAFTYNGASAAPVNAGSYPVAAAYAGNANYASASNNTASVTINKATPTIDWANPSDITYGTLLDNAQLNTSAVFGNAPLPGAFTHTPAAGTLLRAGNGQALAASFAAADSRNFNTVTARVLINVLKATLSFSNLSSPVVVYGTASAVVSGKISFGSLVPSGSVLVGFNNVTQPAQIQRDGTFLTSFATSSLMPVNPPYRITFNYGGDSNFNGAGGVGTLTIAYNICALYDQTKAAKSGSTIPIKLQLCDANSRNASSANITVTAVGVTLASNDAPGELQGAGDANPDDNFRYDSMLGGTGGYIFNLKTTGLATGTYNLHLKAGTDPTLHMVKFQVK